MTHIIQLNDIKALLSSVDVISDMADGFIAYSKGETVVPPVGELHFDAPKGDVHLKYGYIKNDDFYVVKIASGFHDNLKLGVSPSQGLMLVFSQKTGKPEAVLLDEGHLTDIRTAAAGAVVSRHFAPKKVKAIGIIGNGIQAQFQLEYLKQVTPCRTVWVWGRDTSHVLKFKNEIHHDFEVNIATTPNELAKHCNLIITTTPSEKALLKVGDVQPGTHITAVGSDTANKQELESELLNKADIVIADSIPQSKHRGEIFRAVNDGCLSENKVIELGNALENIELHRQSDNQISIADLTGVAVQDIKIASAIYRNYKYKLS